MKAAAWPALTIEQQHQCTQKLVSGTNNTHPFEKKSGTGIAYHSITMNGGSSGVYNFNVSAVVFIKNLTTDFRS